VKALAAALLLAATCAAAAPVEVRVTDAAGKPLPQAVVFLESREARAALKPAAGVEVAQAARQFAPQVTVVPVGTAVSFPNRDSVRHHVYSFSATKKFEIKLYVGTPTAPVVFDQPGIAVLGCNIHDHMAAWVVVVETPYYAQTGADGRVSLPAVPPGSYRLRVWHASLPPGAPAADSSLKVESAPAQAVVQLAEARP
jgi:plastocyanin